jgi:hypothetical protein
MKPWIERSLWAFGVPTAIFSAGLISYAIMSHAEDPDREKRLSDVEKVAVQLGKIHEADEAAVAERVKLCNAGAITACSTCREVGVELDICKKK